MKEEPAVIEVKNLTKKYGDHVAVDHLSFTIESGQIYGFLGPNGAGKSTTMNIMTGYLGATEGEVLINGCDILEEPEQAKHFIGYLPELPPLYMDMTVDEYLEFAARLKKIPKLERKEAVRKAKETAKIEDVSKRLIKNLSKGYKQRVGLAQAVLGFPEIIILDEPTVGLDPKQIIEIRDLIKSLKNKHTIILSSHILSEVSAVCDKILIISKGKLVACDTPEGLTRLMTGEAELEITVKGTKEKLLTVLEKIGEIEERRLETVSEDQTKAIIKTGEDVDIREPLFYLLAEEKLPLLDMHISTKSLEDIFLELTDSEKMNAANEEEEEVHTKKGIHFSGKKEEKKIEQEETDNESNL